MTRVCAGVFSAPFSFTQRKKIYWDRGLFILILDQFLFSVSVNLNLSINSSVYPNLGDCLPALESVLED